MRTKTVLLSALLGTVGSVSSVMAQNVYSLNAVGYINVTVNPGFNMISCPLIGSPDNTLNTLLPNTTGAYQGDYIYEYSPSSAGGYLIENGVATKKNASGWAGGGADISLTPGVAVWYQNNSSTAKTLTFVGTVPSGSLTNTLTPGFNLVGSILPVAGDLQTNSLTTFTNFNLGDYIYVYDPATSGDYDIYDAVKSAKGTGYYNGTARWSSDPDIAIAGGFWYENNSDVDLNWVENYSVSQ